VKQSDHSLLALANALREAVVGKSKPRRIAAARRVIAALAPVLPRRGGNRRGRKPHAASEWAHTQLMSRASSVDGPPDSQALIVKWLRDRFDNQDMAAPSDAWLKKKVSKFKSWILIRDRIEGEKWRASPTLQEAFETEKDFLQYCRIRERIEEKWLHDKGLQQRFETPSAYFASVVHSLTGAPPAQQNPERLRPELIFFES